MVSLKRWTSVIFLGAILSATAQAGPVTTCSKDDFTAGGVSANECQIGGTANDDVGQVNTQFGPGFTFGAKYDMDTGLESGSIIDLMVTAALGGTGFNWSIPNIPFRDAVFVVKQANPNSNNPGGWVGYLFTPLEAKSGTFRTTTSFAVNDYSHVSLYTRGKQVPEMDAAGAGLAFAFLSSLLVLVRERQS